MSQMVDAEGTREPLRTNPELAEAWVHEVLAADQLSTAKLRFGHVRLTRGTVPLLWGLRIYALLTIFLIGVQIWRPCAPAGERRAADVFTVEEIHV
jgi:hypothetical protein